MYFGVEIFLALNHSAAKIDVTSRPAIVNNLSSSAFPDIIVRNQEADFVERQEALSNKQQGLVSIGLGVALVTNLQYEALTVVSRSQPQSPRFSKYLEASHLFPTTEGRGGGHITDETATLAHRGG